MTAFATQVATQTGTYTDVDVENVVRRLRTDLLMIAESTGVITSERAKDYGADIELLAIHGYLKAVDLTLLNSSGSEEKALRYTVNTEAGDLTSRRPGGVAWPYTPNGRLQVILMHTRSYTAENEAALRSKLNFSWSNTSIDTTHSALASAGGRDYSSSNYGMQRKDWA